MQIKIKFSQSDLKKRAAKCLDIKPGQILSVSPTLGGRSYMVLWDKVQQWGMSGQRIDCLTIWQIVDAIPLEEKTVSGEWNLDALGNIRQLCHILGFTGIPETRTQVKAQYRKLSKACHPDQGGSAEAFLSLRIARDRLMQFVGE